MTADARELGDLLALVNERLADATASLTTGTGGGPMCRTGPAITAAKTAEGRAAALMQVRRSLRKGTADAPTRVLIEWRRLRQAQGERHDRGWQAYWAGGIAELERLTDNSTISPDPAQQEAADH